MRLMVTGAGGMAGSELTRQAAARGWACEAYTRADLNICDQAATLVAAKGCSPDVIINAAAYTAVDDAERNEARATLVNGNGAENVARAAAKVKAAVIHISTDYVFDGTSSEPYQPFDPVNPLGAYGRSKLAGEIGVRSVNPRHMIVRTSWVYSHEGRNFVRTMLRLAERQRELRVVDDQHGCPTSAADLAGALLTAAAEMHRDTKVCGTHHFTNSGVTTWYDFAKTIFDLRGGDSPVVRPGSTAEYPTLASRPAWSALDCSSFETSVGVTPRPWRDALRDTLELMQ